MKNLFTAINLVLVISIAYVCVTTGYTNLIPQENSDMGDVSFGIEKKKTSPREDRLDRNFANVIIRRNLFNAAIEEEKNQPKEEKKEAKPVEELEPTTLKLVLWGTVTGDGNSYAVIEDKQVRRQSLYSAGDMVQGAKIREILRNRVVLTFQGKDQLLEIQEDSKKASKFGSTAPRMPMEQVPAKKLTDQLPEALSSIMRQIKFRPHFSGGEQDGVMVYGIRPNSVFREIGLRNGDIVQGVNGRSVSSTEDMYGLLNDFQSLEGIDITLLRRGKETNLSYSPPSEIENEKEETVEPENDQEKEPEKKVVDNPDKETDEEKDSQADEDKDENKDEDTDEGDQS